MKLHGDAQPRDRSRKWQLIVVYVERVVVNREEEEREKREEGVSRMCDKSLSDTRPKVRRLTGWYTVTY